MMRRSLRTRRVVAIAGIAVVASVGVALATARQNLDTAGFWASVYLEANEAEHYDSLPQMRDAADAVVLGSITEVTLGRVFAFPPADTVQYVTAVVQVDRVLSGQVQRDSSGHVLLEVMLPTPGLANDVIASTPRNQSIFFLRHKATELANLGAPADVVAADELFYRLVTLRAVVWTDSGKAAVHPGEVPDFLTALGGRPFDEVVRGATK